MIVVAVMPGADAVSGALALAVEVEPEVELEPVTGVGLELEEQAATASAAAATTAIAGARSRFDLFIECLPFLRGWIRDTCCSGRQPSRADEIPNRPSSQRTAPWIPCGNRSMTRMRTAP